MVILSNLVIRTQENYRISQELLPWIGVTTDTAQYSTVIPSVTCIVKKLSLSVTTVI